MGKSNEESEPKMVSYAEKTKTDPKTIEPSDMVSVIPVFTLELDVFGSISEGETLKKKLYLTHTKMYKTVSEVVHDRIIIGLQRIRGLWRIYLDDESERDILVSKCITISRKTSLGLLQKSKSDCPSNNFQNKKRSKCLQEGRQTKDCTNVWVYKSCGQDGHKQYACTKDTFSDVPEQSVKKTKKKTMKQVMQMMKLPNLKLALMQNQHPSKPTARVLCESASATGCQGASATEREVASATGCEDDNGQSHSIINPIADLQKERKPK
ncbi:unnamed protein product [Mytilus coruscus]|uniref:CCHC-type domain-containing protein n=1 Tax=Mytilus coruscus TaxID=42192 RepID=A0A6J8CX55_MYTCO|nr:unnamed protein product [Mytilus coruscus]